MDLQDLDPAEGRAIAFNRWRLYNERRRMQKNLGQVLERVRSLEEDSVELRTTNEELRILEKNSISKIASLSSDNVDLTKQLLSLRTISLALNKQLTDQNARNKELEISKAALEEALLSAREVARAEADARRADAARTSSERDQAVAAQRALLDRLSARDFEINALAEDNRKLSIAVTALQKELCDVKCRAERRERELAEAMRTRREEVHEEFREERRVVVERGPPPPKPKRTAEVGLGGEPAAYVDTSGDDDGSQSPGPSTAELRADSTQTVTKAAAAAVDASSSAAVGAADASSTDAAATATADATTAGAAAHAHATGTQATAPAVTAAETDSLRQALASTQTEISALKVQLSSLQLSHTAVQEQRDQLQLNVRALQSTVQQTAGAARAEARGREAALAARRSTAESLGSLRDAFALRAAFDAWRLTVLRERVASLAAAYETVAADKVALTSANEEKRLCIAVLMAAHRWRVHTLVRNVKALRDEMEGRERAWRALVEGSDRGARGAQARTEALVTIGCLMRDEWTLQDKAFGAWRLAAEFARVLRAQQARLEHDTERRNHALVYGRDSTVARALQARRALLVLLRTFRGWRALVPKSFPAGPKNPKKKAAGAANAASAQTPSPTAADGPGGGGGGSGEGGSARTLPLTSSSAANVRAATAVADAKAAGVAAGPTARGPSASPGAGPAASTSSTASAHAATEGSASRAGVRGAGSQAEGTRGAAVPSASGRSPPIPRFLEDTHRDATTGVTTMTTRAIQAVPPFRFGRLDFQQRARALENHSYKIAGRLRELGETIEAAGRTRGHYGYVEAPVTAAVMEDFGPLVITDALVPGPR